MPQQTPGDVALGRFLLGLLSLGAGGVCFLQSTGLLSMLRWNEVILRVGGLELTMIMLAAPLVVGLVLIALAPDNLFAWLLVLAPLGGFGTGVALRLEGRMWRFGTLELALTLTLVIVGAGLLMNSVGGARRT